MSSIDIFFNIITDMSGEGKTADLSKQGDPESKIHKKDIGKLNRLGKPNLGDDNDSGDDDEFEELLSNIDCVEGEMESIRDSLNEMRSQIAQLRKKFGMPKQIKKHHNSPNGTRAEKPKSTELGTSEISGAFSRSDDDLQKILQLSLKER